MTDWVAVVLAGGFGTRLRSVAPNKAKALVPVAGRPFIEWILEVLRASGITCAVISTGHLAGQFAPYEGTELVSGIVTHTVRETEPLGTAGGFLNALSLADTRGIKNVLVVNGDSIVISALRSVLEEFDRGCDGAGIVGVLVDDAARYGSLELNRDRYVTGFREKMPGAGVINAGIYLFRREVAEKFPANRPLSFETEVFPHFLKTGVRIRAFTLDSPFLDIGIPEALESAEQFMRTNWTALSMQVKQ